jgi:hypothetical protein
MSGIVGSNLNIKGSGLVAALGTDGQVLTSSGAGVTASFEDVAGGITWQAIETGSTMTAVAGNGYWINTTSNTCTITLPASATNGDEIIFADYDRTWGTNKIIIDSNGLNYQGDDDSFDVEYSTDGQAVDIVYSDATNGWIPISDDDVEDVPSITQGLFGFGITATVQNVTNTVSGAGVVSTDVTGVGTARSSLASCEYGGDKGIFGYGDSSGPSNLSNKVSNVGVVATDTSGVGTARYALAACSYGGDKGIFGYGRTPGVNHSITNLVSNAGVVATDTTGVGTARHYLAATEYGGDKGIFGYGTTGSLVSVTNLVSNAGVVATDTTGVGTARKYLAACRYGTETAIFAYGDDAAGSGSVVSMSNKISSSGVAATDVTGVGTARSELAACEYSSDKGIFAYGRTGGTSYVSMSNLVSNAGVIGTDVTGVGTARYYLAACSFG